MVPYNIAFKASTIYLPTSFNVNTNPVELQVQSHWVNTARGNRMQPQFLGLPDIPLWTQQLAGILPFSALIEFIDVGAKIHLYELTGRIPLWKWPITPAGARLLLSSENIHNACCLDRPSRSAILHCIDGKFGDLYPCNSPATTRLYLSGESDVHYIPNESSNMTAMAARRQKLTVVHFTPGVAGSAHGSRPFALHSLRYWIGRTIGWLFWITLTIVALFCGQYYALAYYLLMPITGLVVCATHGFEARQLMYPDHPSPDRLVVVTNSLNASEWWAFYGKPGLINAMLNKPLYRSTKTPAPKILKWLTQLLIISQWVCAVGSCALQNWNALFISLWIVLCALESAYGYPPESNVHDWLSRDCNVVMNRYQADFSSRRAMLSALVYMSPDSRDGRTKWIDPILADAEDRREWEAALLGHMNDESKVDDIAKHKYWWKFILEGMEMGKKLIASFPVQRQIEA